MTKALMAWTTFKQIFSSCYLRLGGESMKYSSQRHSLSVCLPGCRQTDASHTWHVDCVLLAKVVLPLPPVFNIPSWGATQRGCANAVSLSTCPVSFRRTGPFHTPLSLSSADQGKSLGAISFSTRFAECRHDKQGSGNTLLPRPPYR
jgi:hypothetical protein